MRDFLLYLLQNLLVLDILILVLWGLDKRFQWKMGHLWRKWIWFFICIRMIFPFELHLQDIHESWNGIQIEIEMEQEEPSVPTKVIAEREENENGVQIYAPVIVEDTEHSHVDNNLPDSTAKLGKIDFIKEYWEIAVVVVWAIGFIAMLFYHVFQYYLVKDFYFEEAVVTEDEKLIDHFQNLCMRYHIRRMPVLMEKEDAATPMTFGYINRKIVFPPNVYTKKEITFILKHELTHMKNLDSWYKTFVLIICDLYWFNPVFLLMKQMAYKDVEYVCDEIVTRSMEPEEKKVYGTAILKTVNSKSSKAVPSMVQFAVNKAELKKRLNNLFIFDKWTKGVLPFVVSVVAVAGILLGISVSIKEVVVEPSNTQPENTIISVEVTPEKIEPEEIFYTNDLEALNKQRDMKSSYITEKYCFSNLYYIDESGSLWGTGRNDHWQLGMEKKEDINSLEHNYDEPVKIAENVIHVDASSNGYFVIWLTKDGKLYGMGANAGGALLMDPYMQGTSSNAGKLTAKPILLMEDIVYASAGCESICALNSQKEVWWWGTFAAWTGSSGPRQMQELTPKLMLKNARYTVCGPNTAAAIDENNQLWTWGCNVWGQCGIDTTETGDYLKEAKMVCENVEMVWPEILSTRQNTFDTEFIKKNENYYLMNEVNISYTTFIRKTDGNYYACGFNLGTTVKAVDYFGDLYIEDDKEASDYLWEFSSEFLPVRILEKPQEEWAPETVKGEEIPGADVEEATQEQHPLSEEEKQELLEYTYFSDIEEKVTADDVVNLRDIPSQDVDSTVLRQLKNGEIVTRTGISDTGWSRLVIDGETYYAVTSYLTTDLEYRTPDENGDGGLKTQFATVSQKVTPKIEVNLRKLPSVTNPDAIVMATAKAGEVFTRTGISQEHGWSRVEYQGQTLYCVSSYIEIME